MRKQAIVSIFSPLSIVSLILFLIFFTQCSDEHKFDEKIQPINPSIEVDIIRFDQLLKNLPIDQLPGAFEDLRLQYPAFSKVLIQEIFNAGTQDQLLEELQLIVSDSAYQRSYDDVQSVYKSMKDLKAPISQALENYMTLFDIPFDKTPDVYAFISGFTYQTFLFNDHGKNGIGLGLDMFLGEDFPYNKVNPANPAFSNYLIRSYNKDHIVKKIVEVLVEDVMLPPAKSDFMNLMIWGGKKIYLIDEILNFVPDTVVTEYSDEQLKWCRKNETQIWNFFFEQDLFYESDIKKFNKLIGPAPTSPGMPPESPGSTGNYMGWQIIRAFMNRNPDTTIEELIRMNNGQDIFDKSKYKPRR